MAEGERGRDGATGAEGRAGTTGVSGTPGTPGSSGSAGATGAPGTVGATGATGAAGPRARYGAVGFLILMTFNFFGFVHVEQESNRAIQADRQGCERVNVLRLNQAQVLQDQITQTKSSLRRNLGAIEPLRDQLEASISSRSIALQRLRESVGDYPVKGRPYAIDCVAAFP